MGDDKIVVRPSRPLRIYLGVWCAVSLLVAIGCVAVIVRVLTSPPRDQIVIVAAIAAFGGLAVIFTVVCVSAFPALFVIWEADDFSLRVHEWRGTAALRWDEVARYRIVGGGTQLEYVFHDAAGQQRVSINFGWLEGTGRPLFQLMQRKLREVLPEQNHDLPHGLVFHRWRLMLEPPESSDSQR